MSSTKIRVGQNRREAERALRKIGVSVDDGAFRPQRNISFDDWAKTWLETLERKPTTRRSYASTVRHASRAFGRRRVRDVRADDIARLMAEMKELGLTDSTRSKHLRVLGTLFSAAVQHDYAAQSPVSALPSTQKPRPTHREAAYFQNDELQRLFQHLPSAGPIPVIIEFAVKTGARQGELLALHWADIDLGTQSITIRRSVTDGFVGETKNRKSRVIDVSADVAPALPGGEPAGLRRGGVAR